MTRQHLQKGFNFKWERQIYLDLFVYFFFNLNLKVRNGCMLFLLVLASSGSGTVASSVQTQPPHSTSTLSRRKKCSFEELFMYHSYSCIIHLTHIGWQQLCETRYRTFTFYPKVRWPRSMDWPPWGEELMSFLWCLGSSQRPLCLQIQLPESILRQQFCRPVWSAWFHWGHMSPLPNNCHD